MSDLSGRRVGWVRWVSVIALMGSCATLALGCGDEGEGDSVASARLSDAEPLPSGDPIVMTQELAALPLRPPIRERTDGLEGDLSFIDDIDASFDLVSTRFNKGVITLQLLDERRVAASGSLSSDTIRAQPSPAQPRKRLDDLFDEVDSVFGEGNVPWDSYVLVIDLFRISGNWLVRWNGVNIDDFEEPGLYGLWRDDMRNDTIGLILSALDGFAEERNITHLVIGHEMERLLVENGVNAPTEFANFAGFYDAARAEIKAAYPELQISAGINWDRLSTDVAARYTADGAFESVTFSEVRRAWAEVGERVYAESDFLALSAEPDPSYYGGNPSGLPESQYALLSEVQDGRPIYWYAVNWPVTSDSEKNNQKNYFERFLALNAGNSVDLIAWRSLMDQATGTGGECNSISTLGGSITECFSGVFSTSAAPTRVTDVFVPAE